MKLNLAHPLKRFNRLDATSSVQLMPQLNTPLVITFLFSPGRFQFDLTDELERDHQDAYWVSLRPTRTSLRPTRTSR